MSAPTPAASKKKKEKKKAQKGGGSNVFDQFSQRQVAEFKEGFQYMDINFTQLINMFGQRQQGGASDEDEVVIAAFAAFADGDGMIDCDNLKASMTTWGEKYTAKDVKIFYEMMPVEKNKFPAKYICDLLTGK